MDAREAVILIGHGGVPSDCPKPMVGELKALESARMAKEIATMSPREAELDAKVRHWPRTPQTDPYKSGLERIVGILAERIAPKRLVVAYNEFCHPSLPDAVAQLAREGIERVILLTTMLTPGGSHAEFEIPRLVSELRQRYPQMVVEYAWPYDLSQVADFFASHIDRVKSKTA
ncbi:MAG: CbiX/SirB N-terminal domain-containing protein [Elusimicrobiota bacterium]